jgi:LAO/AO transport system kinase
MMASGAWQTRRETQLQAWLHTIISEQLMRDFYDQPAVQNALPELETAVRQAILPPTTAALQLLQLYRNTSAQADKK